MYDPRMQANDARTAPQPAAANSIAPVAACRTVRQALDDFNLMVEWASNLAGRMENVASVIRGEPPIPLGLMAMPEGDGLAYQLDRFRLQFSTEFNRMENATNGAFAALL